MNISLSYIGQQITIYVGFLIILLGLVGNGLNIYIFSSVRMYRATPCSFYFLVGSIHNIFYLLINVTTRIINVGYGIDLVGIATVWCKIRQFCLITLSLITLSCSCLATIDQYLVTSQNAYLRHWSRIETAHRIVCIIIVIWCLHGIPCLLFYTILPDTNKCTCISSGYTIYISVCILILITGMPVTVMAVFGNLAYRNIRQTIILAEQQADRQLTRMTLIQVALVFICITPYGVYSVYMIITTEMFKDAYGIQSENFVATIFSLLAYFYYAGSCYMFLISSSRFRRSLRDKIVCWRQANQINPCQPVTYRKSTVEN